LDDRSTGLILRAAARLKQQAARADAAAPTGTAATNLSADLPRPQRSTDERIDVATALTSRETIIDRERFAAAGVSFPADDRSRLAEEFRIIKRAVIARAAQPAADHRGAGAGRLILVTSARPLEGKTFVAANLALSIASERESRALVVDCDSVHQSVSKLLGIEKEPGFGDWLAGDKTEIAEIMLRTNIANFSVIPAGRAHSNIPEMLSSSRVKSLFEEMARRYSDRYIVLDAPPCLAASEATIIAPLVGQIVFVVEAFRTQREEVEESLRLLQGCPQIGLVLNKSEGTISEQFGSYSYY
jgi:exopolysaccharide/PEP-CTERM locus tyrosine autokinase